MKIETKTISLKRLNIRLCKDEAIALRTLLDNSNTGDNDVSLREMRYKITSAIGEFIVS